MYSVNRLGVLCNVGLGFFVEGEVGDGGEWVKVVLFI